MLIVLTLIAGLAAFVATHIGKGRRDAQIKQTRTQLHGVAAQVERFAMDTGRLPESLEQLTVRPTQMENWRGPYLPPSQLLDGWKQPVLLKVPGSQGQEFEIRSLGADGKEGGRDDAADLSNWY